MQLDIADLETHRRALTGHCYRMLGSVADAQDAVQDTILRAWRNLERFEGRASVRTWLYRIATNVCLDALSAEPRRARPMEEGPAGSVGSALESRERTHWLEPIPDLLPCPRTPILTSWRCSVRASGWRSSRRCSSCRRDNAPRFS
jgi:RNA polymerase sigma-70 factor (ECF subfamily)